MRYLIKNLTILGEEGKPLQTDLLVEDGRLLKMATSINDESAELVEGEDLLGLPGFCDLGAQVNDPGYEHREDIQSLQECASAGGYTHVAVFPNTNPSIHTKSEVNYIKKAQDRNLPCSLSVIGAVTKDCKGTDIAEMMEMDQAGALAFSDGRNPLRIPGVMMRALLYVKSFGGLVINRPEEVELFLEPQMHEGALSTSLGMRGQAAIAEDLMLHRDISLLRYTDSRLLVYGISCAESVDRIRAAKEEGLDIKAAVPIWNLVYTDKDLAHFDTNYKMKPMLRSEHDRQALIEGIKDGTIDMIVSNHDAFDHEDKKLEFPFARFGAIGLQTLFPVYETFLKEELPLADFIRVTSEGPRQVLDLPAISLEEGEKINLAIFDRKAKWTLNEETNLSKCDNSPVYQKELNGKQILTIN